MTGRQYDAARAPSGHATAAVLKMLARMDVKENMERWKGAFELIEVGLKIGLSVMAS
jgi:hypothetical protein